MVKLLKKGAKNMYNYYMINLISNVLTLTIASYISYVLPLTIYTNILDTIYNKFKVKRLKKSGYIVSGNIPIPPKVDEPELKKEIAKLVIPYVEKLKDHLDENNLNNLYRNLKTLRINDQNKLENLFYAGQYNSKTNTIKLDTKKDELGHELLHLASSYYDEKTKTHYVGFKQGQGKAYIGIGLNEGYTELLNERIFNKNNKKSPYKNEMKIAKLFEYFFEDKNEMENYYFNNNLPGFIHHMEQFAPRQEIINLILDIDRINETSMSFANPLPTYLSIKTQLKLYDWYANSCPNRRKLRAFKNEICKSTLAEIALSGKQAVLKKHKPLQNQVVYSR